MLHCSIAIVKQVFGNPFPSEATRPACREPDHSSGATDIGQRDSKDGQHKR
jgi:hypothetical protein